MLWRRLKVVALVSAIAALHYFLYLGLWGSTFAMAERVPGTIPAWLRIAVGVLGAPLMLLPESWFVALRAVFGDDTRTLLVTAAFNALIWATTLVVLFSLRAARRHARSNAAAA
jgi:hypothetical protein